MDCPKLSYCSKDETLNTNQNILAVVKGKKHHRQKTGIDYSTFGSILPGRSFNSTSYKYGYQGSEKDDEIYGSGNSYTTEFRQLDTRTGRWWGIDPLAHEFPWQSPYVGMDNNPIFFIDPNGDSTYNYNVSTNKLTMISDVGGNEQQIVNFVNADGSLIMLGNNPATAIIDGSSVFVTPTKEGTLVSAYDPLDGLSPDYNSNSGYVYTASDLMVRHSIMNTKLNKIILKQEAEGNAQPIAKSTHYDYYVKKYGTDKAFSFGAEHYFPELFPGGETSIMNDAVNALKKNDKKPKL